MPTLELRHPVHGRLSPEEMVANGPVLEVFISAPGGRIALRGLALIDTGAQSLYADWGVLERVGSQPEAPGMLGTGSGTDASAWHGCSLRFPDAPSLGMAVPVGGIRCLHLGWHVVLGRQFLNGKRLLYDGVRGVVYLAWGKDAPRFPSDAQRPRKRAKRPPKSPSA